jgi:hypothetical protein
MTVFPALEGFLEDTLAIALVLTGMVCVWRGLRGHGGGEQALLRTGTAMLGRIEGFRMMMFGLVLIGLGLAVVWQAEWLLWLAIGIGFVEILESSVLIAVWKRHG